MIPQIIFGRFHVGNTRRDMCGLLSTLIQGFHLWKKAIVLKAPRFSDDMLHGYMQTYTILKMKEHYKFRHR